MGGGAGGVVEEGWWRVAGFAFDELGHGYIFGGVVVSWCSCERVLNVETEKDAG